MRVFYGNIAAQDMEKIIKKALNTRILDKEEIIHLLSFGDNRLYSAADKTRKEFKGNSVHLRALIEFTNICQRNCFYCGLRCDNKNIERYRLSINEILECAKKAKELGYKTVVLQGGEDAFFDAEKICNIIKEIKKLDLILTLSFGEKDYDEYKAYKKAGADRYLLRIETTDKSLYKSLHPNMNFDNRVNCLYNIKSLGFETGTGSLVGLPNQTIESLAEDILFFKKLDADMVGIGPFIPHPDTPLAYVNKNNFDLSLKVMAATRLLLPDINIPATTAMETLKKEGRIIALESGANVIMPNITIEKYKAKYAIYPNKTSLNGANYNTLLDLQKKIYNIGRTISKSNGFRNETL